MMLFELLSISLVFVLTAFVAGNNLSAAVGTLIGSRIVSRFMGVLIGILGFSIGLVTEGSLMGSAAKALMPHSYLLVSFAFAGTIAIFLLATIFRSPISLTMSLIGISAGIAVSTGVGVNQDFLLKLALTWSVAPVVLIFVSKYLNGYTSRHPMHDVWREASLIKVLLVAVAFLTGYTLGANTMGLIADLQGGGYLTITVMIAAIITGAFLLSGGVIKRVGEEIFSLRYHNALTSLAISSAAVEFATLFGIPLSSTQTISSSIFGVGLSHRYKMMYTKPFLTIVATWIISPLAGFLLGLLGYFL